MLDLPLSILAACCCCAPLLVQAADNTPPVISAIDDQSSGPNTNLGPLAFEIGDAETDATNLVLTASSSNTDVVPDANVVFGGSGSNRTATITPATNAAGSTIITITVTDESGGTTNEAFLLTVFELFTFTSSPVAITDKQTSTPFSGISVSTSNQVSFSISFSNANGSFDTSGNFTKSVANGVATYQLTQRQPSQASNFLQGLVFTPTQNRIPLGSNETTTFQVKATDETGYRELSVALTVSASNDAPSVTFTNPAPSNISDKTTSLPLANLTVSDPDVGDTVTVKITFPDARGSLPTSSDLTKTTSGTNAIYTLSARTPASAQAFLRPLVFTPVQNRIPLGENETTRFVVTATDSLSATNSGTVDLQVTPVNDPPRLLGTVITLIYDNTNSRLFTGLSIQEVDVVRTGGSIVPEPVSLTVSNSIGGGEGGTEYGSYQDLGGVFTYSGTCTQVTANVGNVLFVPVPDLAPTGATNSVMIAFALSDTLTNSPDNHTVTLHIVSANNPPILSASTVPSSTPDTTGVLPFRLTINDPDFNDNSFTVGITQVSPASSFGTLAPSGPFTGDKLTVESAIQGVRFTPIPNLVTNSQAVQFRFSVTNHGDVVTADATLTIQEVNDLPAITGVPLNPIRINDDQTALLFGGVSIADVDRGGAEFVNVTISMDDPNKGTLSPAGPFGPLTNITPAQATAAIRAVQFTPSQNRVPVGQSETTVFTIQVTDALGGRRVNSQTTVIATSVNGAPQITGISPLQPLPISPEPPVLPFGAHAPYTSGVGLTDDDPAVTVTVSLDNAAKGVLTNLGEFALVSPGVYQIVTNAEAATLALTNLQFVVSPTYSFPPGSPGGTTFTITVLDGVLNRVIRTLAIVLAENPQNLLVTRVEDDLDPGSLRYAAANAKNGDMITFALPNYPGLIRFSSSGPITIDHHITIKGPGAELLTLSGDTDGNGQPDTQLFRIRSTVTMEGIAFTQGAGAASDEGPLTGGALYVAANGRLTLRQCVVADSRANQWGGGIDVDGGALLLDQCLLRGNQTDTANGLGGGAVSVYTDQACEFVNTTFSANRQRGVNGYGGGALYVENLTPGTMLEVPLTHCTFAENEDSADLGSSVAANVFGTFVIAENCIFNDGRGRNLEVQGAGEIISAGGNLSDDSTRTILTQFGQPYTIVLLGDPTDRTNTAALLLPLDSQITPTPGYPLASGSPAIGLALGLSVGTDQRGVLRDSHPDAGAIEFNAFERILLNEIHFDPLVGEPDFLEFYVDLLPVDLNGFTLRVDGTDRYTFSSSTVIQPGRGVVFADNTITAGSSDNPTLVISNILGGALHLESQGRVELLRGDGKPVLDVQYLGQFFDPLDPANTTEFAHNSITLAPQFMGFALLPHSIVAPPPRGGAQLPGTGDATSPGRDTANTPFGSPNALPVITQDTFLVNEDELAALNVLANDLDANLLDRLVVVDVSQTAGLGGDDAEATSTQGATIDITPAATPLRGTAIVYDPRSALNLQQLPEGARRTDTFYYSIVDIGVGPITDFQSLNSGAATLVVSPAHRLTNGEPIAISGAAVAAYNGEFSGANGLTVIDDNSFSIPVTFSVNPAVKGSWVTIGTRMPTERAETNVLITVLGANDPPTPANDTVITDEETVLRLMGDTNLAGSTTAVFETDPLFPQPRQISPVSLLANDTDPDTDDNNATLKIVGIAGSVHEISGFAGTAGSSPVIVTSPGHGLADGTQILISGYRGHPSYNGYHTITLMDSNSFAIPIPFVDHNPTNLAVWTILNDANRLNATSALGAAVTLEIRADRTKTCVVYNPRTSAYLNGTALGQTSEDSFYYAVQDSHSAVTMAKVNVQVTGVDDAPVLGSDPASLGLLNSLVTLDRSLEDVIAQIRGLYLLPPASGLLSRTDVQVLFTDGTATSNLLLANLFTTGEDTVLVIAANDLLANDSDVDRGDVLTVKSVASLSHQGAALSLDAGGSTITYDPATSSSLNALAREELKLDSFFVVVTDSRGADVTNLVSLLVVGANDTPVARDDSISAFEDIAITLDPIHFPTNDPGLYDYDFDINGIPPDNRLSLLGTNFISLGGAQVSITSNLISYDPTASAFLNGLAHTETYDDVFQYTLMDGSFIFANDDFFRVAADGTGFTLNVLANDRNYTAQGGALRIASAGTPNMGGSVTVAGGTNLIYTPQINFVGDEVFTYTVSDDYGETDSGLVTVRVTVDQLNGNLQANNDYFTTARGESSTLDVLANDNTRPATGATLTVVTNSSPSAGGQLSLAGNRFVYTPDPAATVYPYHETFTYEISGGGSARAVATVDVTVIDRENTLNIRDDAFAVQAGSHNNTLDVLLNDNILPGSIAGLTIRSVSSNGLHGVISIDTARKALIYSPNLGFVGEETLSYVVTDGVGGTGSGSVRISVGSLGACNDFFVVSLNATQAIELDVLTNDFVLQGTAGGNITVINVAATTGPDLGPMAIRSDGLRLLFGPATAEGEQEFDYTISDGSGRTAIGHLTLDVVSSGVKANSDYFAVSAGSSGNLLNVLANDAAIPDLGHPLTVVSIGSGVDAPNHGGNVSIAPGNDRLLYAPAAGFTGEETFTYTMTDSVHTDVARVVIKVTAGDLAANDDAYTVFFEFAPNTTSPRQFTLPVLSNDRALPDLGQQLTITTVGVDSTRATNAPAEDGSIAISSDGLTLVYAPRDTNGPFPYVERFAYEITDGTARRAAAVVVVEVQQRAEAHVLDTDVDIFSVQNDSVNNLLPVLANDNAKPATPAGWILTAVSAPLFNGSAAISGTNILYTPKPGFVGTDRFTYSVSDGLGGTGSAEVRVKVGDLPVSDDVFSAISGTSSNVLDVLANDALRHAMPTNYLLLDAFGSDSSQSERFIVDGGVVLYSPDPNYLGGYPYTETFFYRVQDNSFLTVTGRVAVTVYEAGSDRDTAVLSVTVHGVNDPPTITGAAPASITDKETVQLFANVTINEVDAQGAQPLVVTFTFDPAIGYVTNLGGFTQSPGTYQFTGSATDATAAIRAVVYVPIENRITVPTTETNTFTIVATDGIASQPTTNSDTVITVRSINDPPIITGTVSGQTVYRYYTIRPFSSVRVIEVDDLALQPLRVTVALDNPAHGFLSSLDGFVDLGGGLYRLGTTNAGVSAAAASQALQALVFNPTTDNRVTPLSPETTRFTITVDDGFAGPVMDNTTTVLALHEFQTKATASDGVAADHLGSSVAASRDAVVAGAPQADPRGLNSGAAYVYKHISLTSTQWTQFQKLVAFDGATGNEFGNAVAISGNTLAVAAHLNKPATQTCGAVYVYEFSTASNLWTFVKKVTPFDGLNSDDFGCSVSLDQDTLVVGARGDDDNGISSGTAFVFDRNKDGSNNWGFVQKLTAADAAAGDEFGYSVAVSGDTILVGSHLDVQAGLATGSAYLFRRNPDLGWAQLKKLVPTDGRSGDAFGESVGIYGDIAVIGAPRFDVGSANDAGAAYIFQRDLDVSDNWGLRKELTSPTGLNNDQFGYSVSVSRDKLVIGLPFSGYDNQSKYGSAYAFARHTGGADNWGVLQQLARSDPGNNDQFGIAVAVGQDTVAVGANFTDAGANDAGSVYIYRLKYDNAPILVLPIPDQIVDLDTEFWFAVAAGTFADPDVGDTLTLSASLADGSPLPVWLSFDASTAMFSGTQTSTGSLAIRVTASDEDGATAAAIFSLGTPGAKAFVPPAPPLYLAIAADQNGQFLVTYLRPRNSLSSEYVLQVSEDLVSWTPGTALIQFESVVPAGESVDEVTLRVNASALSSMQFYRILNLR